MALPSAVRNLRGEFLTGTDRNTQKPLEDAWYTKNLKALLDAHYDVFKGTALNDIECMRETEHTKMKITKQRREDKSLPLPPVALRILGEWYDEKMAKLREEEGPEVVERDCKYRAARRAQTEELHGRHDNHDKDLAEIKAGVEKLIGLHESFYVEEEEAEEKAAKEAAAKEAAAKKAEEKAAKEAAAKEAAAKEAEEAAAKEAAAKEAAAKKAEEKATKEAAAKEAAAKKAEEKAAKEAAAKETAAKEAEEAAAKEAAAKEAAAKQAEEKATKEAAAKESLDEECKVFSDEQLLDRIEWLKHNRNMLSEPEESCTGKIFDMLDILVRRQARELHSVKSSLREAEERATAMGEEWSYAVRPFAFDSDVEEEKDAMEVGKEAGEDSEKGDEEYKDLSDDQLVWRIEWLKQNRDILGAKALKKYKDPEEYCRITNIIHVQTDRIFYLLDILASRQKEKIAALEARFDRTQDA